MKTPYTKYRPLRPLFLFGLILALGMLACNLQSLKTTSEVSKDTEIALAVQSTSLAEIEATLNARQTQAGAPQPATETPAPPPTDTPAEATAPEAPTEVPTPEIAADTPTAEPSPTTENAEVTLADWGLSGFVETTTNCYTNASACWYTERSDPSTLTAKSSVYIDPNWSRPTLVLYHKYKFTTHTYWSGTEYAEGSIYIQANGTSTALRTYSDSASPWKEEHFSLEKFTGKEITVKFSTSTRAVALYWYIQSVKIVPNYVP